MSIARHHNEWLSLIEISGPFLSMPVLMRTFPQGLNALDHDQMTELRLAYNEWLDNQNSLRPSPAIHSIWIRYVLEHVLSFEKARILEGPAILSTLSAFIAEQAETLHPDLVIADTATGPAKPRMLVQVCPMAQGLEKTMQNSHWKASPSMRMLELLRSTGVQLGLVTNGEQWMLVNAPKGETSSFVSWYAALWLEEPLTYRAFTSLLGSDRFFSVADEDTLEGMLKESMNNQQEVTDQLGYQVRHAVEVLIRAIDKIDQDRNRSLLKDIHESDLYEAALTVMMRLVFLFSAEERGMLLLGDPVYDENYAVSTLRTQLHETADHLGEDVLERRFDAWCRLLATFRAVHDGIHHDRLMLPAYGGSLFDPHRYPFLEGRTSKEKHPDDRVLPISNRTVLHLLDALQVLRVKVPGGGPAEARRLSFRALDVEQIGHVYEGLLDHIAIRAKEAVLGLTGTRENEPEIPISVLKAEAAKGEKSFLAFLKEQTGRSENALRNAWQQKGNVFGNQHLQIACNNDPKIYDQVLNFAGLLREDDFGYPAVFLPGSVYVTAGATRRATGTHYTPRSLTEPIVQHTLEPLVYTGPAEGWPKEKWHLKSPAELLDLKICDMAMGSAGFLVQVIRYLSERLVEAWETLTPDPSSTSQRGELKVTPEGRPATGKPNEIIIPKDDEERLVLAKRLVADRCIYGVDKNPLAVEIAKLSIWLTTMDKGRPFTFLDHALKCGDSLVGADEEMYRKWAYSLKGAQFTLYLTTLEEFTAAARQKRKELESFTVLDVRDAEHKAELLKEADAAMARVKLGCDLLVGVRLMGLKPAEHETMLSHLLWDYVAGLPMDTPDAQRALHAARKERAFHWPFEFPEVFENGGFTAIVGNPPFVGGKKISSEYGMAYQDFLKESKTITKGAADLCAYFFLSGYLLLKKSGILGLIATNTISQGDTREVGLDYIEKKGGKIIRANNNLTWPGSAAVVVDIVHIIKGNYKGVLTLDNNGVTYISPFLDNTQKIGNPFILSQNRNKSYIGTFVNGIGFVITDEEAKALIQLNPKNKDVLFPFLNGQDLNTNPDQSPDRWIINFFDLPIEKAKEYPDCLQIVTERVKPFRDGVVARGKQIHEYDYWKYWDKRPFLYNKISILNSVLVISRVTKYVNFSFLDSKIIFSDACVVFAFQEFMYFALLSCTFHNDWAWKYSSTMGGSTLRYSPTDAFETFPFPKESVLITLDNIGTNYYEHRRNIMVERQEGLTATYNHFHDPKEKSADITHLRELHIEMDNAVASAYGWSDLDLGHGFHETPQGMRFTISETARREVLARLLQLNHERYEEEVRQGLHEKDKKKAKEEQPARQKPKKLAQPEGQMNLPAEPEVPDEPDAVEVLPATPTSEIGSWDQCVCLVCGKHLTGFLIEEHTKSVHEGKDPGYRKI
jgi:hypothetical protein